ncbi:MAG: DUF1206 domain-containing protein [Acidimicrobiia bacterium]|nr:DUF1206 domain-containing protein [Acidimicrobiia bacterium]
MSFVRSDPAARPQGSSGSESVEDLARAHPGLVRLVRAGWLAKGVVYVMLGVLALPLALQGRDEGEQEVSQTGALAELASTGIGSAGLYVVAAGLALYVIWRLVSVALPAESSAKVWAMRLGYLVSAAIYAALAWTAFTLASSGGSGDGGGGQGSSGGQDSQVEGVTSDLMEMTGGRLLVGAVGLGVVALGILFVHRGWTAGFADELESGSVGPVDHDHIIELGRVGWVARGVMLAPVGYFLMRAAMEFSPDDAKGLDGALREATGSTIGSLIVGFVAFGLIVYGAFCIISAPRARLTGVG